MGKWLQKFKDPTKESLSKTAQVEDLTKVYSDWPLGEETFQFLTVEEKRKILMYLWNTQTEKALEILRVSYSWVSQNQHFYKTAGDVLHNIEILANWFKSFPRSVE